MVGETGSGKTTLLTLIGALAALALLGGGALAAPNPLAFAAYQKGDYAAALKLFLVSAEAGDADAQYNVGAMYANALGVETDYATAARWFQRAAASNNPNAQVDLAGLYAAGQGVQVLGVVESQAPADKRYEPGHPLADGDGYVYAPNVNVVEEMVNMISASRSYQSSVEVMNTAKELANRTLSLGR